ncbi:MAG: RDD family protein [Verrucomicrobiota bacterium]
MEENDPQLPPVSPLPRKAGLGVRCLAFTMDVLVVFAFWLFLTTKILLPEYHPTGLFELKQLTEVYAEEVEQAMASGTQPPDDLIERIYENETIREMLDYSHGAAMLIFWAYFGLVEALLKGGTLGKSTFRLRAIKVETGQPGNFLDHLTRGATKTIALLLIGPLLWINYLIPLLNQKRRAGHDFVCRTIVVAE